jgi:hypothetical protein
MGTVGVLLPEVNDSNRMNIRGRTGRDTILYNSYIPTSHLSQGNLYNNSHIWLNTRTNNIGASNVSFVELSGDSTMEEVE